MWTSDLTRAAATAAFLANVNAGDSRLTAWTHVRIEIDEVLADLVDNGLDDTAARTLLQWWDCDVDHRTLGLHRDLVA